MRDVLFRGKSVLTGEWLYGSLINNAFFKSNDETPVPYILDTGKIEYGDFADIGEQLDDFEVIPESVGQFTGYKDKKGKDVYEGDVLYRQRYWGFYVSFENGSFVSVPLNSVQKHNWDYTPLSHFDLNKWEVSGSKYNKGV